MDFTRPILWRHGLFLQPQHLQLNELYQQSRLDPLWEFLQPWFWGVTGLELMESSLATMNFEVTGGRFLFPDGSFAIFPGNSVLEPRSFDTAWTDRNKPLSVYIGLRKISLIDSNVTLVQELKDQATVTTRYLSSTTAEQVQDLYLNGEAGQVQVMQYQLRIFFENELDQLDSYELLPIARLEQMTERIRLVSGYIPPVMSVYCSDRLYSLLRDIRDRLAAKGRQLESYKKLARLATNDADSRYLPYIMALSCLNRHIPILTHYCETGQAHPSSVYAALRQVIGELSSFSSSVDMNGEPLDGEKLPVYRHTNLWECFSLALAVIETALVDFMTGPEFIGLFEREGDTFYIENLDTELFHPKNHFFLVVGTDMELNHLLDNLGRVAKVTSRQFMPTIVKRALAGIELSFLAQPPREAPGRSDGYFFRLDDSSRLWKQIVEDKSIALHWDNAPVSLKLELMIVRR